jgi:hypothetical protein
MYAKRLGLTGVPTHLLERLLRALHWSELETPITINGLAATGLQDVAPAILGTLRGLSGDGVRAVLVAVLAERQAKG